MKYYIVHTIYDDGGGTIGNDINLVTTSQEKAKEKFTDLVEHEKQFLEMEERNWYVLEQSDAVFVAGDGVYGSAFIEIKISEYTEE